MGGQLRLLNIACATKAQARTVVLTRATREEILNFSVLGGIERGCGIFISKVEPQSKAHESGLKRGDQVCMSGLKGQGPGVVCQGQSPCCMSGFMVHRLYVRCQGSDVVCQGSGFRFCMSGVKGQVVWREVQGCVWREVHGKERKL